MASKLAKVFAHLRKVVYLDNKYKFKIFSFLHIKNKKLSVYAESFFMYLAKNNPDYRTVL